MTHIYNINAFSAAPRGDYEVDYSEQAAQDFAWYASMNEAQLSAALRSMPVRRNRVTQCKDEILRVWRDCPSLTYAEIAQRVGCHPQYVYSTVRRAGK